MAMSSDERRALLARAHGLNAQGLVGKAGLTEAVLGQLRGLFVKTELIKLRLPKDKTEAEALVQRIAAEVPCELVGRLGFTAVFFCAKV